MGTESSVCCVNLLLLALDALVDALALVESWARLARANDVAIDVGGLLGHALDPLAMAEQERPLQSS